MSYDGRFVRAVLRRQHRQQTFLVEVWGLSEAQVSRILAGIQALSEERARAAAAALGVDPGVFGIAPNGSNRDSTGTADPGSLEVMSGGKRLYADVG